MVFAAKEAYDRRKRARLKREEEDREKAKAEGRVEGRVEGRAEGREQIRAELERRGMLTPELTEIFEKERKAQE